ncbi:MAG TPA: hypothetical protein VKZ59_13425 [Acidobacteriota bacterium]|nr:hypothetical protein [Acidobacteriota bacterium]
MKVEDLCKDPGPVNSTVTQNIYIKVFDPELRGAAEGFSIEPRPEEAQKNANNKNGANLSKMYRNEMTAND